MAVHQAQSLVSCTGLSGSAAAPHTGLPVAALLSQAHQNCFGEEALCTVMCCTFPRTETAVTKLPVNRADQRTATSAVPPGQLGGTGFSISF